MMDLHAMGCALVSKAFARKTDPETSQEAADSVKAAPLEVVVLEAIKSFHDGCTADEVAAKLPTVPMNTITPRFASLIRKRMIVDTGIRRKGKSGRSQRVLAVQ